MKIETEKQAPVDSETRIALRKKHAEANLRWRKANRDRDYANHRKWNEKNKERRKIAAAKWRTENKEKAKASKDAWNKANPERVQAHRDAWLAVNRKKNLIAGMMWKEANPEKYRAIQAACGAKRRAAKRASQERYTFQDATDLLLIQKKKCAHPWCRISLRSGYHVDHIIPLAKGGSNGRKNIQILCPRCNVRKNAKHPVEVALENGMLV